MANLSFIQIYRTLVNLRQQVQDLTLKSLFREMLYEYVFDSE